jgi:hypothetical protein
MEKPKIVVLCGSSRFVDIMAVCAWLIERDEKAITMGLLHLIPQWYLSPDGKLPVDHLAEHEGVAAEMDELCLRKIDLADEVFVVDFSGYVGESTEKEIKYAKEHGKLIRWYMKDAISNHVDKMIRRAFAEQNKEQKCRVCGCTDNDCHQCIEVQGHPCHWVEDDLCSRCAPEIPA